MIENRRLIADMVSYKYRKGHLPIGRCFSLCKTPVKQNRRFYFTQKVLFYISVIY